MSMPRSCTAMIALSTALFCYGYPTLASDRTVDRASDLPNAKANQRRVDFTALERQQIERRLIGGAERDALRVLGRPNSIYRIDANLTQWWYKVGSGFLKVRIIDGKITSASNERSTGVREDDVVSVIEP